MSLLTLTVSRLRKRSEDAERLWRTELERERAHDKDMGADLERDWLAKRWV